MKKIVIFASGSGTNAENIIRFFSESESARVVLVLSNKREAGVLDRADRQDIDALYFNRKALYRSDLIVNLLKDIGPDLIVLAGFLWKFPDNILRAFPGRVINIHPALLPKYGGRGMYGMNVHRAITENRETESGITIHHVNENYDEGAVIFQARVAILPSDTPEDVAGKVHALEYEHFPRVIAQLLTEN
ncbi:phosphoribosylglycinamide formyltransferase [Sinomicrobium soli]|uniref:phosphoribosylglycinamide formyltransferase n=1 Tax=Sinomicrobium sp. N-1-3-6 TaxID=2219864 RepID=UPI000DCD7E56|nr:phosphoribosylglycinamide formyltransferase [Sinomicrobium sp. N-1-3-6]RAV28266.1 phosphoribosylglycinamide formyltransferase [Sinomicrobium sp. N-1-3-6]